MAGVLQAPPTTALYDRMEREGRLNKESRATSNFSAPNFETVMPTNVLLNGLADLLHRLYDPDVFFARAVRSLEVWTPTVRQKPPDPPVLYTLRVWLRSVWKQGVRSNYRKAYWKFAWNMVSKWRNQPAKLWLSFSVLLSAHHFVIYSQEVAAELEQECRKVRVPTNSAMPARMEA
jgi:hypothetical protein